MIVPESERAKILMTITICNRMSQNLIERAGQNTSYRNWKNESGFCWFRYDSEEVIKKMKMESNSYERSSNRTVCDCKRGERNPQTAISQKLKKRVRGPEMVFQKTA